MYEVPSHQMFLKSQGYATNGAAGNALDRSRHLLRRRYNNLENVDEWSPESVFMSRWRTMDAGVTTSVVRCGYTRSQERLSLEERFSGAER